MIGQCVECGETDDLHAGCGLCDLCVAEFAAAASQREDDIASGLASFERELHEDFCDFEVDGYGNIS
mgnify:FL=1